ncbi:MAG: A/G-specific adenine glycosylase [Sandaracinus sp.]
MTRRAQGSLRARLLAWYDRSARDLPWRRTRDPYAIWVSEIMLQQTRVETVIPYFERFLARLPTIERLARATEDEVLSLWSGLGYYRRARLLHRGARIALEEHGGAVPEDPVLRAALPGIGRYTAGAIGSIAFDREEPIVDGNVARVLSRVHGIDTPLGARQTEARLWQEAEALVRGPRPGALNQALMELGALVCTPLVPRCEACPLAKSCVARREGSQSALPVPRAKRAPRAVTWTAVVASPAEDARVWLVRGEGTLFGGLFGVPSIEGDARDAASEALAAHGLRAKTLARAGTITHVLTHRALTVQVWAATVDAARASERRRLVDAEAPGEVGVSTLTRKILRAARDQAARSPRAPRPAR